MFSPALLWASIKSHPSQTQIKNTWNGFNLRKEQTLFFFFFFLLYKQMSLSHLRPGWQIIFLAQFFFFLSFFPLSPQLQIHAWECLVISCVCSTQPVPDVPVQRGRCSSMAPVATPSSQVGMLLLYLFLWYENTYCFRFIDCYFAMWH